jgi:hypothetical protein
MRSVARFIGEPGQDRTLGDVDWDHRAGVLTTLDEMGTAFYNPCQWAGHSSALAPIMPRDEGQLDRCLVCGFAASCAFV